jgi:hypothetical protein
MIFLPVIHLVFGTLATLAVAYFSGPSAAISCASGAGLTFLNLVVLVVAWPKILAKKHVAWAILVIVSKIAILAWILYEVVHLETRWGGIQLGWFAVGFGLVFPSVVATAARSSVLSVYDMKEAEVRG